MKTMQKAAPVLRSSEILRGLLSNNPKVTSFSVERILRAIGHDRVEASLMIFSLPQIVPVSVPWPAASVPNCAIAYQVAAGHTQINLPRAIRRKTISRRALAVAIHAVLPVLEAAEKVARPRWSWVSQAATRRALGLLLLLLALAVAFPLFGFNPLHATSIFVMALGMAERDGLAILLGAAAGVLSLALLAASGVSARALRTKAGRWLRKVGRKFGLQALSTFLRKRGYVRLARIVTLQWSDLLMLWNPEKRARASASRRARPVPLAATSLDTVGGDQIQLPRTPRVDQPSPEVGQ